MLYCIHISGICIILNFLLRLPSLADKDTIMSSILFPFDWARTYRQWYYVFSISHSSPAYCAIWVWIYIFSPLSFFLLSAHGIIISEVIWCFLFIFSNSCFQAQSHKESLFYYSLACESKPKIKSENEIPKDIHLLVQQWATFWNTQKEPS